ncbi:MAG: DUF2177 family protein [Hyphomicrobiaceae bacterium]|nr:DUF2177 family protein [Hyphomicrobiaceae bacterium]
MIIVFFATLAVFVILDAVWIVLVALKLFQTTVGGVMRGVPKLVPVALFYFVFCFGLIMLAIRPALLERSSKRAVINGALLGLVAYATFDLTNLAIIEGWTPTLAAIDMAWGTAVSAISALVGYWVATRRQA